LSYAFSRSINTSSDSLSRCILFSITIFNVKLLSILDLLDLKPHCSSACMVSISFSVRFLNTLG
jgi:hypothetical protein